MPKPKKTPKTVVAKLYSGRVKITVCNDKAAVGIDQTTGKTIGCIPRFKGASVGELVDFKGNQIMDQNATTIAIAPRAGMADTSPYVPPPNAAQVVGGAIGVAGSVLGILGSIHR